MGTDADSFGGDAVLGDFDRGGRGVACEDFGADWAGQADAVSVVICGDGAGAAGGEVAIGFGERVFANGASGELLRDMAVLCRRSAVGHLV